MQDAYTPGGRLPRLAILQLRGLDHFMPDLAAGLAASGEVEVRSFTVTGPDSIRAALAWTDRPAEDAIWFEFCWPPFPDIIARTDFGGRRVVMRVHRIEAYGSDHAATAPWQRIDDAIVVGEDMARRLLLAAPHLAGTTRLHVIHNGLDMARHGPAAEPPDPFRIGWCGWLSLHKNPNLALEILHRLRAEDQRWTLHLSTKGGEPVAVDSFAHLARRMGVDQAIHIIEGIPNHVMPEWHARNAVLLSTSVYESFGYAIAEAAAMGCDLAVLDNTAAAEFWPEAVRFATVDEAVRLIREARPGRWRGLVEARFGLERQVAAVLALLRAPRSGAGSVPRPAAIATVPAVEAATAAPGFSSARYWEERYRRGASSGAGSYGRLAVFKAHFLNEFARLNGVRSVIELGCGDGHQLGLFDLPRYSGVDVSPTILERCRAAFADRAGYGFFPSEALAELPRHDLALSLDVIYHLIEDTIFETYLDGLFGKAERFVLVYSSNIDAVWPSPHVRHRRFTEAVARRYPAWRLVACVPNPYPYRQDAPDSTSFADFFVFAAPGEPCVIPTEVTPDAPRTVAA